MVGDKNKEWPVEPIREKWYKIANAINPK